MAGEGLEKAFFFGIYFAVEKGIYSNAQVWQKALSAMKTVDYFFFFPDMAGCLQNLQREQWQIFPE